VSAIEIRRLRKSFGAVQAVRDCSVAIPQGEFVALLGPSGCGKTSLLRLIGGFLTPDEGSILIGGNDVARLPPFRRNIGFVFQSYALFPHLTVEQNLAFGLKMRGTYRASGRERIRECLEMVKLSGMESRMPHQLSGGQQQRVALARALVIAPDLLLLDEPLGALDRKLREAMQLELKVLQRRVGITTLFVTHDQDEALTMADRVIVMNAGSIEQIGTPSEIYENPKTRFVAEFIGSSNFFSGEICPGPDQYMVFKSNEGLSFQFLADDLHQKRTYKTLMVRPEKITVDISGNLSPGANRFKAEVVDIVYLGNVTRLRAMIGKCEITALITNVNGQKNPVPLKPGHEIFLSIAPVNFHLIEE
jgi:spermidine/putrescine ABC transporter ATP-binding subunit